jgi:hypothetical protein
MRCSFGADGVCRVCGKKTKYPEAVSRCGVTAGPKELSEVDCIHLLSIGSGETPACCGGTALVEVGECAVMGRCTVLGRIVDGAATAACLGCKKQALGIKRPDAVDKIETRG